MDMSTLLIGYPLYKSSKIPRPTLLVIPGMIQKVSENKWDALYNRDVVMDTPEALCAGDEFFEEYYEAKT